MSGITDSNPLARSYERRRFRLISTDSFSGHHLVAVRVQVYEKGSLKLSRNYV